MQEPHKPQNPDLPPVLTPKQLAIRGKTSVDTIYRLLRDPRKIKAWGAYRVGERWCIPSQVALDIPKGSLAIEGED